MKKLFAIFMCVAVLAGCSCNTGETPKPTPAPTPTPVVSTPETEKIIIEASEVAPIEKSWTTLGNLGILLGGESTDIVLATSAMRDDDGYMMWDDSQEWRLVALGENKSYSLLDETMVGISYIDVSMENDIPSVKLITSSTMGLSVTEYTYEDGAFYKSVIIEPDSNGNQIYNSFPEYFE